MRDALGSLNELIDDLNICIDERYFGEDALNGLKEECYALRAKLKAYVSYLRRSQRGKER
jgi:four helix bundle protein